MRDIQVVMLDLIDRFKNWASDQPGVRAGILLGSWARNETPADGWSDLDLLLFVTDPEAYLAHAGWLSAFGVPALSFVEATAVGGFRERRVTFDDGRDVDFSIVPIQAVREFLKQGVPAEISAGFRRGYKVLVDKDDLARKMFDQENWAEDIRQGPTEAIWRETSHDFLYHVILAAKKLRRGELWVATVSCNSYLKRLLLTFLEWQSKVKYHRDTWHKGRFIEQWADPAVLQLLPETFAAYSVKDVERSLLASLRVYEKVARDIAGLTGYQFPEAAYLFATDRLTKLVAEA